MVYLITYDLRFPGRDYTNLYNAIKDLGDWRHPMESTWFVHSTLRANEIYNRLCSNIDTNDRLLVIEINSSNKQGWLSQSFWGWLNSVN